MSDIPTETDTRSSPTTALRESQLRAIAFSDAVLLVCSADYADADLEASRAAAAWGNPVDVRGRDAIVLMVELTKVTGQTGITIALQAGAGKSKEAARWFDRHCTFELLHGSEVAIPTTPRDLTIDVSGYTDDTVHRIAVEIETLGNWMRFKPYGSGTLTGSRCTISGIRKMEGS